MKKVFVVNFDESVIFKTRMDNPFYDEKYETFEEAKEQLVSYWDNVLAGAKNNLKGAKKMKLINVQVMP
jgi:hypothetical protein